MASDLSPRDRRRGMAFAFVGQSLGILLFMLLTRSAFGPLFLKQLGASDRWTLWVLATPVLLPLIQIPLALAVHPRHTKRMLIGGWTVYGLAFVAAAALPFFGESFSTSARIGVGLVAVALIANLAANTFWFPLLHDVVPKDFRGRFFGRLRSTWGGLLYLAVVIVGVFLGESPELWRFQIVVFAGFALVLVRNGFVSRVPLVARSSDADHGNVGQYIRTIAVTPGLWRFLVYFALVASAAGMLGHPLVLYMKAIGVNPRDNLLLFGCTTLGMVAALLKGGAVIDKTGTLPFFKRLHAVLALVVFTAVGVTFLPPGIRPFALGGVFLAAGATVALLNLACTAHLFQFVPTRGRIFFLSLTNFMLFLGPAVAAFVSGIVLGETSGTAPIPLIFLALDRFQIMLLAAALIVLVATAMLRDIVRISGRAAA